MGRFGRLSSAGAVVALCCATPSRVARAVPPPEETGKAAIEALPPERVVRVKVPTAPPEPTRTFQMGLEYTQFFSEEGQLAHPGQSARAIGLRFVFPEGRAVRQQFAIAHQWERQGETIRQGFRIDLLALEFPIPVAEAGGVRLDLAAVLRPVRGQILFEDDGTGAASRSLLRFESGFALGLRMTRGNYFLALEPLSIDFRTVVATRSETRTGFSRVWSTAAVLGRDF
jgi:hypothetical protein